MELNELVAQLKDDHDSYGQWLYFLSIYADPGSGEPWGWQIDGHHLCIATVVFDGRIVTTPTFMGSEPRSIGDKTWFDLEEEAGLLLIRSLANEQRTKAIIHSSITKADMPDPALQNPFDGRQVGGMGNNDPVVPYQGLVASDLSDAQRRLLLDVARTYTGWNADDHAATSTREWIAPRRDVFSWYGGYGKIEAFYYRVHSPVTSSSSTTTTASSSTTSIRPATTFTCSCAHQTAATTAETCWPNTTSASITPAASTSLVHDTGLGRPERAPPRAPPGIRNSQPTETTGPHLTQHESDEVAQVEAHIAGNPRVAGPSHNDGAGEPRPHPQSAGRPVFTAGRTRFKSGSSGPV